MAHRFLDSFRLKGIGTRFGRHALCAIAGPSGRNRMPKGGGRLASSGIAPHGNMNRDDSEPGNQTKEDRL
jgi:hypothetical protein